MDHKVVAVVGTARRLGTVNTMCERLLDGARDRGSHTELVNLFDYEVRHCLGCWQCYELGRCVQDDDFHGLFEKVWSGDVIVLGSPVYLGTVPGIMKTFFDRHTGVAVHNPENAPHLHKLPFMAKAKRLRAEVKRFGARREDLRGRGFVLVISSTLCFPYTFLTGQTRLALKSLAAFPRRVSGRVLAKLVFTDTLLKFQSDKHERKLRQAYTIGQRISARN
jgi:multimeric flavodoxin WrbA